MRAPAFQGMIQTTADTLRKLSRSRPGSIQKTARNGAGLENGFLPEFGTKQRTIQTARAGVDRGLARHPAMSSDGGGLRA
jgi:hypothetical protein